MDRHYCLPLLFILSLTGICGASPANAQGKGVKRLLTVPLSAAPSYQKRALVVGVTDYTLAPQLHVCANDAHEFTNLLKTRMGFTDVTVMTDDPGTPAALRPTRNNLRRAVHALLSGIEPNKSEVVLFYSGHGVRSGDSDWLVPEDGDPKDISGTCLNYSQIVEAVNTARPARTLLVTDACRSLLSGKGVDGPSGFGKGLGGQALGPEVAELLSCAPTEVSQEGVPNDFPESVFTHFLVKGLEGDPGAADADTKTVTFDSLMEYLKGSVSAYVRSHFNDAQTPDGRATLGSMVLAKVGAMAPTEVAVVPPAVVALPPGVTSPFIRINPKDGAEMVYIPAGPFLMGDDDQGDNPRHTVTLSGYWIYKNDVTVAMYRKFCDATGRAMPATPPWGWKDEHPIVGVNWYDAIAYCKWAGVGLPTEAQWEKAARGTDGRKYPWGNDFDPSRLRCSRSSYRDSQNTLPIGSFPTGASPYGCLDMAGNVCQWCADWYWPNYWKSDHGVDPSAPAQRGNGHGVQRGVLRGGSWGDLDLNLFRTAHRNSFAALDDRNIGNGFRGARGL